jgi:hypothetical protein
MAEFLPQKPSNQSLLAQSEQEPLRSVQPPQPPSSTTCALVGCLFSAVVFIGVALAIFTIAKNVCAILPDPAGRILGCNGIIRVREPVIDEIRRLERLDAVELNLSAIVTVRQRHTFPVPYTEILVYGVCGRAIAGVDLRKLEENDLIISGSTITVTLPHAEVFSVDPTPTLNVAETDEVLIGDGDRKVKTLEACNQAFDWTGGRTPELMKEAQEQAMTQFRAIAEDDSVLERARRNAEKELARFLLFAGYDEVRFIEPEKPEGIFEQLGKTLLHLYELTVPVPEDQAEP